MIRPRFSLTASARMFLVLGIMILSTACSPSGLPDTPPDSPESAALRVFQLAQQEEEASPEGLGLLFRLEGEDLDEQRGALLDALATLRDAEHIQVQTVEPLTGSAVTAVDLSADLPGGGSALYSVHALAADDGSHRVVWFMGPGADWPSHHRGRGTGLTTSAPPTTPGATR